MRTIRRCFGTGVSRYIKATARCFGNLVPETCALVLAVALLPSAAGAQAVESPKWWQETRAFYAPFALSGAGGPLMKYPSQDLRKVLATAGDKGKASFENLPAVLADARKLGTNCIYLVDYWEPNYENKGDYIPRADLGGPEAFRKGIAAVHAKGGRVIVYLEAFIVTRTNPVGVQHPDWAMQDANGKPYAYYGRDRFYLMYPGEGSGWAGYLCGLAERIVRDYGVDGFHLDSYGCQWDWKDYNPAHPGASDPSRFNTAAVDLVRSLRTRIQKIKPEAVVILECCERPELLDVCDGGQLDSAAWLHSPVKVINQKPWAKDRKYRAFTSHFSMEENEKVLKMGYNLSLTPWFFQDPPDAKDYEDMRERIEKKGKWQKRITTLWYWDNLLYINGVGRPAGVDLFQLRRDLDMAQYGKGPYYDTPAYLAAVEAYIPLLQKLYSSGKPVKTQEEHLRSLLTTSPASTPAGTSPR